jgi:hypothetical protein
VHLRSEARQEVDVDLKSRLVGIDRLVRATRRGKGLASCWP